jgi:hypothetical protein
MSGGKGGSQSTQVEIPPWAESAMIRNLDRAERSANIGYMPDYGPSVAAFNPTQIAAMDSANSAAAAFGLGAPTGSVADSLPTPQEFAGGVMGYSSAPLFEESVNTWAERNPSQNAQYSQLFVDRFDGSDGSPARPSGPPTIPGAPGKGPGGGQVGGPFQNPYSNYRGMM